MYLFLHCFAKSRYQKSMFAYFVLISTRKMTQVMFIKVTSVRTHENIPSSRPPTSSKKNFYYVFRSSRGNDRPARLDFTFLLEPYVRKIRSYTCLMMSLYYYERERERERGGSTRFLDCSNFLRAECTPS